MKGQVFKNEATTCTGEPKTYADQESDDTLSCNGIFALHLWSASPYAVEIIGGLNFGERQGTSSRTLAIAETSSDRGRATGTFRGGRS